MPVNYLLKVAEYETSEEGVRIFYPTMQANDDIVYTEFINLVVKNGIIGDTKLNSFSEYRGTLISELIVGKSFAIASMSTRRKTSMVVEIVTDNLFLTLNSVYYLKNELFFKRIERNEKINKIIND